MCWAQAVNFPDSYSSRDSPRYNGSAPGTDLPPKQSFPYTPPNIAAIAGEFMGIAPNLKPPMSYLLNASFARKIPSMMTIEIGYAWRLSHPPLIDGAVYTSLE